MPIWGRFKAKEKENLLQVAIISTLQTRIAAYVTVEFEHNIFYLILEHGPMHNVMAALGILVAPSVENDEERKFHNSILCTMLQSLADAHCSSAVQ